MRYFRTVLLLFNTTSKFENETFCLIVFNEFHAFCAGIPAYY